MRPENIEFLKKVMKKFPDKFSGDILEVGSFIVPGQENLANLRPILSGAKMFVGCDMRAGKGVDQIQDVHKLTYLDNRFDVAICIDTLEHVKNPHVAINEMKRVLRPNGVLLIVSVMNCRIHDYPQDFWRFTPEAFNSLLEGCENVFVECDGDPGFPTGIYGYGTKPKVKIEPWPNFWHVLRHTSRIVMGKRIGPIVEVGVGPLSSPVMTEISLKFGVKYFSCDIIKKIHPCNSNHTVFVGKSLDFFDKFKEEFSKNPPAMVLLDGEHTGSLVYKEVELFLSVMDEDGVIFLHDTLPKDEMHIEPQYCGDAYKARLALEKRSDLQCFTWPYSAGNHGVTMVMKKNKFFDMFPE